MAGLGSSEGEGSVSRGLWRRSSGSACVALEGTMRETQGHVPILLMDLPFGLHDKRKIPLFNIDPFAFNLMGKK